MLSGPEQVFIQFFNAIANPLQKEFTRSELFGESLKSTIALFVVLNPIGTVPFFIVVSNFVLPELTTSKSLKQ